VCYRVSQVNAAAMMNRIIYLPVDKRVPLEAIVRIALVMTRVIEKVDRKYGVVNADKITSKL
jgi:hypothetical protein